MASNVFFHETFQPELTYVAKILELAMNMYTGDKFNISERTGIPTGKEKGKVEPHIKYAQYMGLIEFSCSRGVYSLSPTPLGKMVWSQDRFLHESLTLWLLHYCISREELGAPQWCFAVKQLNQGFTTDISLNRISTLAQKEFGISANDVTKALGVVKNCYMSGAFSSLYFLNWDDALSYEEKSEQIEFGYLYAYALLDEWENMFPEKSEITFLDIIQRMEFGKVFGFNDDEVDSVLSTLEEKGVIRINRQLFPITIMKSTSQEDVLERLYSMLM